MQSKLAASMGGPQTSFLDRLVVAQGSLTRTTFMRSPKLAIEVNLDMLSWGPGTPLLHVWHLERPGDCMAGTVDGKDNKEPGTAQGTTRCICELKTI